MQKVRFAYNPKAGETVITDWLDNIIDIYQARRVLDHALPFGVHRSRGDRSAGRHRRQLPPYPRRRRGRYGQLRGQHAQTAEPRSARSRAADRNGQRLREHAGRSRRTSRKPAGEFSAERSDASIWAGPTTSISSTYSVAGFLPTSRKRRRRYSRTPSASWPTISEGSANCPTSGRCTFRSSPTEATTRDRR